jgi:hypothetical protein
VISAGYIQKTVKADLRVRSSNAIAPWNLRGKVLEDSRRISTDANPEGVTYGAGRQHLQAGRPVGPFVSLPIAMAALHRLLDFIYTVL